MMITAGLLFLLWSQPAPAASPAPQATATLAEADALFQKQENEKALASYERAIAADPSNPDGYIGRGRTLARLRRYDEALASYGEALKRKPYDAMALRYRGHNYINVRKIDLALADLTRADDIARKAAGKDPHITDEYGIYYHLGLARYLSRDFAGAAAAYTDCERVSTTDEQRVGCLAWMYPSLRRAGKGAEAQQLLSRVTPDMKVTESAAYLDRLLLFKGTRTEEEVAKRMSEGSLQASTVAYGIGLWHLLNGRPDVARGYFQKATATDATYAFGAIASDAELQHMQGKTP
jgi:tetratricopeptide (TPR) repeat protein